MLTEEIWKDVEGYEKLYQVSRPAYIAHRYEPVVRASQDIRQLAASAGDTK